MASKQYRKAYYENRLSLYRAYLGGVCVKCSTTENLEFDHIDRETKSFGVSERHDCSWDIVRLELDKCQLLCEACHVAKSIEAGDIPPRAVHGTHAMYRHHGCRCALCRKAKSILNSQYKLNRRNSSMTEHGLGKTETRV